MIARPSLHYLDEQAIIENIVKNINAILIFRQTPLMFAIRSNYQSANPNNLPMILIENGADIHAVDVFGKNAAHHLIKLHQHRSNHSFLLELLKLLINKGINLDIYDIHGKTPFDYFSSESVRYNILRELE